MYKFLKPFNFDKEPEAIVNNSIQDQLNPENISQMGWASAQSEVKASEIIKFSPGFDIKTLKKKDYFVFKNHYKCPHEGCTKILVRQCWPLHVEMDHINGQKRFKKSKDQIFTCLDCPMSFNSRIARGKHRTQAHSKINRRRDDKALQK